MTRRPPAGCTVGIWAGNGTYPYLLADALISNGHEVVVAGIKGHFSKQLPGACNKVEQFGLGALGKTAQYFTDNGADHIFMAGGVDRSKALLTLRPDRHVFPLIPKALLGGDDDLLTTVAKQIEHLGPKVCDPRPFIKDSMAKEGLIAGPPVNDETMTDLLVAAQAAKDLGERDKGQAAIVKHGKVTALESRLGTDSLIANAKPGSVMAKTSKPKQDLRFDIPSIGPRTIENAAKSGLKAIGVEASNVLLLERELLADRCNIDKISLVGFSLDCE